MDSVQCVSLPRSGHNLLVQHLQKYFQSNEVCLSVPKSSKNQISRAVNSNGSNSASRQKFHYCEYYYACRERPCCCSQNCFQKSHDFDLSQPVLPGQKYLVQTRAPLGLLISWFEMRLLKKREKESTKTKKNDTIKKTSLSSFLKTGMYWSLLHFCVKMLF